MQLFIFFFIFLILYYPLLRANREKNIYLLLDILLMIISHHLLFKDSTYLNLRITSELLPLIFINKIYI